jgi:hypothetical protein
MDCWPGLLSRRFTACNRVTAFVCRDSVRKTTSNFDEDHVTSYLQTSDRTGGARHYWFAGTR